MQYVLKVCQVAVVSMFLISASIAFSDDGKSLFDKQCSSCHSIGGGEGGGPDLKGVGAKRPEAWLLRVIVEPDKLTADKDSVQEGLVKKYGYEMPNVGVSRDDAKKIIAYLKKSGGGDGQVNGEKSAPSASAKDGAVVTAAPEAAVETSPKLALLVLTPELIANGRALFIGEKKFAKGGAPCASCHAFGSQGVVSGNLAADLSGMYEKMGEQGVRGVLKALKFPTMKKIYADKSLTDEEITALVAFTKDGAAQKSPAGGGSFPLAGVALLVCAIIALSIYKRRIG
ncbi:MAG: c-type cytochrome [Geobacteraceae bacterium]|nr:c-type cytochrome [Geobacteraceae bacterium]